MESPVLNGDLQVQTKQFSLITQALLLQTVTGVHAEKEADVLAGYFAKFNLVSSLEFADSRAYHFILWSPILADGDYFAQFSEAESFSTLFYVEIAGCCTGLIH